MLLDLMMNTMQNRFIFYKTIYLQSRNIDLIILIIIIIIKSMSRNNVYPMRPCSIHPIMQPQLSYQVLSPWSLVYQYLTCIVVSLRFFLNAKLAGAPNRFCLYMQSGILIGSALLWLAYFVTRVVHFDKACLNIKNFKIQIDGNVLYFKVTYLPLTY